MTTMSAAEATTSSKWRIAKRSSGDMAKTAGPDGGRRRAWGVLGADLGYRLLQPGRPFREGAIDRRRRLLEGGEVDVLDEADAGLLELRHVVLVELHRQARHLGLGLGAFLDQDCLHV